MNSWTIKFVPFHIAVDFFINPAYILQLFVSLESKKDKVFELESLKSSELLK